MALKHCRRRNRQLSMVDSEGRNCRGVENLPVYTLDHTWFEKEGQLDLKDGGAGMVVQR